MEDWRSTFFKDLPPPAPPRRQKPFSPVPGVSGIWPAQNNRFPTAMACEWVHGERCWEWKSLYS